GRRVGAVRHHRRRPGDPDVAVDPDDAAVAHQVGEGGDGGDGAAFHRPSIEAVEALRQVESWPAPFAAVAVLDADGRELGAVGDRTRAVRWASVTKLVTALATLVAAEEGVIDVDEPAGPPGSTLRHLLAHASGLPFDSAAPIARPGARRIYSNA